MKAHVFSAVQNQTLKAEQAWAKVTQPLHSSLQKNPRTKMCVSVGSAWIQELVDSLCYLTIHQPANFTFPLKHKVIYYIVGRYVCDLSGHQRSLPASLDYIDEPGSIWGSWWLVPQRSHVLNAGLMWVPIIWINTQECKAGFLSECFVHYELSLVSPSAWTTLMGHAAPWPSSLLFPCSLAKHCFSGCAMQDDIYRELQALRPSTRVWRWGDESRVGGCVSQMCCASNATFSPLSHCISSISGKADGAPGISDPAVAQDPLGNWEQWGGEPQQCSLAVEKQQIFLFMQLQAQCVPFLLVTAK